jgi:hypothetical protein
VVRVDPIIAPVSLSISRFSDCSGKSIVELVEQGALFSGHQFGCVEYLRKSVGYIDFGIIVRAPMLFKHSRRLRIVRGRLIYGSEIQEMIT